MNSPFTEFHAHIYFDTVSQKHAETMYERVSEELSDVSRGRFHTRCVGPHPSCMFTMVYGKGVFQEVTLWLMENLNGLSAFVHPLSGNDLDDHTKYALWFGNQLELNLDKL